MIHCSLFDSNLLIHVDPALLVVNKPAGLLAVPGRGEDKQDCLIHRLQTVHPEALIVHRLDQATSGLMVLARSPEVHRRLSWFFRSRQVEKHYTARVQGHLVGQGEIDLPLSPDWPNRPRQQVDAAQGKPSLTRWQALDHDPVTNQTRVYLEPVIGRTHQLRVHLRAIGHPIVGDTLYDQPDAGRLMLHAHHLALPHPVHGERLQWCVDAPFV